MKIICHWRQLFGCALLSGCLLSACARQNVEGDARDNNSNRTIAGQPPANPAENKASNPAANNTSVGEVDIDVATKIAESTPPADPDRSEWQTQLAAVMAGESTAIRVSKQSVGLPELTELSSVPELTELILDAGVVEDAQVELIAQLPKLEHLRLRESPLTDAGVIRLSSGAMESLRILNLPQAEVGSEGIESLRGFPKLVQLRLGGKRIDDRAVAHLARLPELRSLHLIRPQLTDQALVELGKSPKLSSLYVDECPLSDEAWERLFSAKPGLHVHIDQAHHDRDPAGHPH